MRRLIKKYSSLSAWVKIGIVIGVLVILGFIVVALFWPPWGGGYIKGPVD